MKINKLTASLLAGALFLSFSTTVTAVDPSYFNPYRSAKPLTHNSGDTALTCRQLDREISRISPYTYNYRPDFDQDPYVGAGIIASATIPFVGYAVLGFRAFGDFMEDKRIQSASVRIESLRRLKAEKHCYEDRG
jgi:hypothetical protein